jgi:putative zinc finger/helix-turn-helix YgiT family protein
MQCPSCEKPGTIRTWEGHVERYGIEIAAHGKRCRECGETLFDLAEMKRQERAIAKQLAMRGVRTGSEFRLVRKVAGLRAVDVAAMLDVTPETVSRWERGTVEIPRAAAYVLGDLLEHPKLARERLEAFAR